MGRLGPPPGRGPLGPAPAPAPAPTGVRRAPPGMRPVFSGVGRRSCPGGGGIGLPVEEMGGTLAGRGRDGAPGARRDRRGAARWRRAGGRRARSEPVSPGRSARRPRPRDGGPRALRRAGRGGGCSLPLEVTTRRGAGAGGRGLGLGLDHGGFDGHLGSRRGGLGLGRARRRRRGGAASAPRPGPRPRPAAVSAAGGAACGLLGGLGGLRGLGALGRLGRLLLRLGRLLVADQALALGLAPDAIGLGVDHTRGVRLDADAERFAEVERLFVGQPELSRELVHADVSWQERFQFLVAVGSAGPAGLD